MSSKQDVMDLVSRLAVSPSGPTAQAIADQISALLDDYTGGETTDSPGSPEPPVRVPPG